jgi:pimeloyl-ACP methyl ester carboxylesterase
MPRIQTNGVELFCEVRGKGDPLLLLSGFGCDHTIWSLVAPDLTSQYRVIMPDNRGVGRTIAPENGISIRQMAEDAVGLLDALGLRRVHVAGHSMGGMIAQELALAYPERVRSLMLLSSCARLDARGKAIIESWGDLPRQVDAATAARLTLPWIYTNAFYARPGAVEQVVNLIVANPFPPTAEGIYRQSRAISASDTLSRLGTIASPTLVVVGKEDILLPVAFSEELARGIPGGELVVLENTGHGLLIESPDAVTSAMLDFLSRHRLDAA